MTAPKIGDRVRIVLEGEVGAVGPRAAANPWFEVGVNVIHPDDEHVVSVEVLPPPEPKWKPGDVVRDAHGVVWRCGTGDRWSGTDGYSKDAHHLPRPLTRLVPEGQS